MKISSREVDKLNEKFDSYPLVTEGESKVVRDVGNNLVLIRLKPTIFSFKANRASIVECSDQLRLRISEILWKILYEAGINISIKAVGRSSYLSKKILPPPTEVIVKSYHVGTPKHIYKNMGSYNTRFGSFIRPGQSHQPYVRFDWRNPLPEKDECLPIWLADQFINTTTAEKTALVSYNVLTEFLGKCGLTLQDLCLCITDDGNEIFGEISPDCMRVKHMEEDLDKDLWRKGRSGETVVANWHKLLNLIQDGLK